MSLIVLIESCPTRACVRFPWHFPSHIYPSHNLHHFAHSLIPVVRANISLILSSLYIFGNCLPGSTLFIILILSLYCEELCFSPSVFGYTYVHTVRWPTSKCSICTLSSHSWHRACVFYTWVFSRKTSQPVMKYNQSMFFSTVENNPDSLQM